MLKYLYNNLVNLDYISNKILLLLFKIYIFFFCGVIYI